jgi:hypothetical protein
MGGNILPPPQKKSGLGENLISKVFGRVFLKIHMRFLREDCFCMTYISDDQRRFVSFSEEIFFGEEGVSNLRLIPSLLAVFPKPFQHYKKA